MIFTVSTFFGEITCFVHMKSTCESLWNFNVVWLLQLWSRKKWFCKISVSRREDVRKKHLLSATTLHCFFFCLGFLSWTFMNHRIASEGGGHFINSSLPLPPASQTLKTLSRQLLQRAHLCTKLAAGLYPGTFGFQV